MKLGKLLDRIGDGALGFAAIGFTSLGFLLVWGRVINSPTAFALEKVPGLGWLIRALRAGTNQGYDISGEN